MEKWGLGNGDGGSTFYGITVFDLVLIHISTATDSNTVINGRSNQ